MKSYEQDILPNSSKEISGKLKEILYNLNSKKSPYLVLHSDVLSFRKIEFPIENSIRAFKEYSDEKQVLWLDINHHFVTDEGILLESIMPDLLHPNTAQYYVWGNAVLSAI